MYKSMKLKFSEVFGKKSDGSITPIRTIRIGGVSLGPGIFFSKGVSFAGVDISMYEGFDIEVDEEEGVLIVKGFYKKNE